MQMSHAAGNTAMESSVSITELFGKENLEDIMRKIAAATGLAFVTVDYRGEGVTDSISFCSFCRKIQESPERDKLCTASNAFGAILAAVFRKTYIYFCPCGLLEVAIPIVVRGQYLGGFIGGQIRCNDAPPDTVQLKNMMSHSHDYTKDKDFQADYEKILQLPHEKFVHITELISLIVNQLGEKEMVNVIQTKYHNEQLALHQEQQRRMELEKDLNESKLIALRSQMNPYFLMSTLTAISNLAAVENAPQTNEVITMFARFLSNSLSGYNSSEFIEDEMKMIERYLFIQKARMGDKLEYSVSVPEEMRLQRIQSMLVFPFVERAVYYGITYKPGNGKISVSAEYEQDNVTIRVSDNGLGLMEKDKPTMFAQQREELQGVTIDTGIKIARQRLEKKFGKDYDLKIEAVRGKGTTCTIKYPRLFDERVI